MIVSMTGFGASRGVVLGWQVAVECRTVNHRGLDTRIHLPRNLNALEADVLEAVRARFGRGRVEVRVQIEPSRITEGRGRLDPRRVADVVEELRAIAEEHGLAGGVTLEHVLHFPEVFVGDEPTEDLREAEGLLPIVERSLDRTLQAREAEGQRLLGVLQGFIGDLQRDVELVAAAADTAMREFRGRLKERVRDAMDAFGASEIDEARLAQELAYYADKADVAEEVQRARSHLVKLDELLRTGASTGVGKSLDFYLQEMMREANTMGSKTNSTTITDAVIRMKSVVEKMREQAANIE